MHMNSAQHNIPSKDGSRETLGVVAKLVAIIVATFVFAAFSSAPAQPPGSAHAAQTAQAASPNVQTPNH
jgi:hypothetical protein